MHFFENDYDKNQIEKILIENPLSFLKGIKLNKIFELIKQHQSEEILEVGTFAGGTAYLLQKEFPNINITTLDINQFHEYFKHPNHKIILNSLKNAYPYLDINENSILKIQNIYKNLEPKINFLEDILTNIDIKKFDFFIIDDNHNPDHLNKNLFHIYKNSNKAVVVIDDCVYPQIRNTCLQFCKQQKISKKNYRFDCFIEYGTIKGLDLFILDIIK